MTASDIVVERLTAAAFAPFGEVIGIAGPPTMTINRGNCGRHHDLATLDVVDGALGISLFDAAPYALPLTLDLVERHPLGSQAFLPMSTAPFLVIVAEDEGGRPVRPRAWVTDGRQGVNYRRGTWHGVLTPLHRPTPDGGHPERQASRTAGIPNGKHPERQGREGVKAYGHEGGRAQGREGTRALFTVIDRIGGGENLEEAILDPVHRIVDANGLVEDSFSTRTTPAR